MSRSIMAVIVPRGPSLASASTAIAAAVVADAKAREQREEAALRLRKEAWRNVARHPERIALQG
jgi:hypothetical protein